MKYFLLLVFAYSLTCKAQDYKATLAAHRKNYIDDFLKDQNSPLKKEDLSSLRFFDADSNYRVIAKVEMLSNQEPFMIPSYSGTGSQYINYAKLRFILNGANFELTVYKSPSLSKIPQYKEYLFLPFTDKTNGVSTYGGGRYIDLTTSDIIKDNTIIIDFNKAYNPYCAYKGGYSCPKPPVVNNLLIEINAGEKKFAGIANGH